MNLTDAPIANILDISSGSLLTTCLLLACLMIIATALLFRKSADGVHELRGIPILTEWTFFTERYSFLQRHFKAVGRKMFRFRVLQHRVLAVSGEDSRKIFFSEAGLNLTEGFRILHGGAPSLETINKKEFEETAASAFIKRLLRLLRKDRISATLPTLLEDINRKMKDWGPEGTINPFKDVYDVGRDLVFQMTIRMATCRELSEDTEAIQKIMTYYEVMEKSATPTAVLLPWFPGQAKRRGERATLNLYNILKSYLDLRRKAEAPSLDPFDILIAEGASTDTILETVMGIIFAGVINTACWALLNLGANPAWKQRASDELKALVTNHTDPRSADSVYKQLSTIPLNAWEDELPSLDLIIRETLRLTISGTAVRRNMAKDIAIGGTVLKFGDFMVYPFADVHLNPHIYSDPLKFDPGRYLEGNEEDKKETFAYLAWGVGRHVCAGMKIAKLEMKLILAMILLGYEYELVDKSGRFPQSLPQQDRDDLRQARPLGEPCYLKFKRVVE